MKLGILHLSDIHINDNKNAVCERAEQIATAARTSLDACQHLAVIVTGDVAFSGKTSQYQLSTTFFECLKSQIRHKLPEAAITFVIAPGNHDCDFDASSTEARRILIEAVRRDPTKGVDSGVAQICTELQSAFFAFRDAMAKPDREYSRLAYEYLLTAGEHKVRILCINTAWTSQKSEVQGSLTFPPLDLANDDATLVITAMHHPYNWLEATNSRAFRHDIERRSDLILTGHEHEPGAHRKVTHAAAITNEFIEGAVLQDSHDSEHSGFNTISIDLALRSLHIKTFNWNSKLYAASDQLDLTLRLNRGFRRQEFEFSDAFTKFLDDPGVSLSHAAKATVTLDDIFVWPNVRPINYLRHKPRPQLSGEKLLDILKSEKLLLLSGAERSGKTTLCKKLVRSLRTEGVVPVLLACGRSTTLTAASADGLITRAFQDQYGDVDLERYKQLNTSGKTLIVDDFDRSSLPRAEKLKLLKHLTTRADYVVLTTSDLTHDLEGIVYSDFAREAEVDFHAYRVQEFGHYLRNALVEKWFTIGTDRMTAADRIAQAWPQVRRAIDTVVGKNFVPSYPVFVLSILQAFEAARPVDTNASTYGYFYEVLVRKALQAAKGDAVTTNEYLARLAWHMFERRISTVSEQDLRGFHAEYERELDLTVPFTRLLDDLERCRIVESDGDDYRFCYRYIYYYFVATHMRDRIGESRTRGAVVEMAGRLHVEEYANIMLFLAHVCRDPFVIDTMLRQARLIYCDATPARLEEDAAFANQASTDFELKYIDGDVAVSRRRLLSDLDELEEDSNEDEEVTDNVAASRDEESEALEHVLQLNVALKTIQILGQILRNFAGSIVGDTKVAIAEECYLLGLRTLGTIMGLVRDNEESVVAMMFSIMRKEYPSAKDDSLFERAKGAVFWFSQIISYGMVKKIAYAVGSERLATTYRRVRERNASVAVSLVDMSLKLDHMGLPPEREILALRKRLTNNPLATSLLSQLVIHHFYMFDVHYEIKQRLCAKMKIPFETVQTADRRQKLVVAPAFATPKVLLPPPTVVPDTVKPHS